MSESTTSNEYSASKLVTLLLIPVAASLICERIELLIKWHQEPGGGFHNMISKFFNLGRPSRTLPPEPSNLDVESTPGERPFPSSISAQRSSTQKSLSHPLRQRRPRSGESEDPLKAAQRVGRQASIAA